MIPFIQAWAASSSAFESDLNGQASGGNASTADSLDDLIGKLLGGDDDEDDDDKEDDQDDDDDKDDNDDTDDEGEQDDEDNEDGGDDDSGEDRPEAKDQSIEMNEDTSVEVVLRGDADDDDSITFSIVDEPENGKLSDFDESNGTVTYEPRTEFHGSDSFSFTVSDGSEDSRPATVNIHINSVNDPPIAVGDGVTTKEGRSVSIGLKGTDADDDDLEYVIVSSPSHGTISGIAPNLRYSPDNRFDGSDSLTFKVNDGTVDSAAATIKIKVESENEKEDESDRWWETDPADTSASGEVTTQTNSTTEAPIAANNTEDAEVIVEPEQPVPALTSQPTEQGVNAITSVASTTDPMASISPPTMGDIMPPRLILPGSTLEVFAESLDGAAVAFVVKAIDDTDGEIEAACSPSSGSTLPVGRFNVICKATDSAGNSALNSFIVVVHEASAPLVTNSPASFLFPAVLTIVLGAGTYFGLKTVIRRLHK
jgi:hypothetical protein